MNDKLKNAIINFVIDNQKEFQLINATVEKFRTYIYNSDGNYLIDDKDISEFIKDFIKLWKK